MFDQAHRFLVEVKNAEKIAELNKLLDQERDAVRGLAKDLHAGTITQQQYTAQAKPSAAAAVALTNDINKLKASTRDLGQATLAAGHTFQDFIQGGVGGVLNNIPQLIEKLGGSAGLAGGFTLVTVAAYAAYPIVNSLWEAIAKGSAEIPKSSDAVDRLTESLKDSKDRLEAMKDSWRGTAEEVAAYNAILAETARIEKQVDEAQKRRKETEAARSQKSDDQAALARDFGKVSGGADYDAIVANAGPNTIQGRYNALRKEYDALAARMRGGKDLKGDEGGRLRDLSVRLNEMAKGGGIDGLDGEGAVVKQVQELVNKARQGDLKAFDELLKATTGQLRDQLRSIDPRGAGARAANKKLAESQIGDFLSDLVAPVATGLKQRNQAVRDVRQTDKDMQEMTRKVVPQQQARASRMAGYAAEMQEAEASTPEELRQSQALDYLDKFLGSKQARQMGLGGLKLDNKDQVAISEAMLRNRDAAADDKDAMSPQEATALALRDFMEKRRGAQGDAQRSRMVGELDRATGGVSSAEALEHAAGQWQAQMQKGADPMRAAADALQTLLQANAAMMQGFATYEQRFQAMNVEARQQAAWIRSNIQVAPTLLGHGR